MAFSTRMRATTAVLGFGLFVAASLSSQEAPLSVSEVVSRVVEFDPSIRTARERVDQAFQQYEITRAATIPNVAFDITPYAFDRRRVGAGPDAEAAVTESAGIGLSVQQALPTSGQVTAGINHRFQVIERGGDTTIEQVPEVSLGFSQPLFYNDNFVDTSVFRAGRRNAELSYQQAGLVAEAQRNRGVQDALELFVNVASLRRSASLLERTIDVLQRQIDAAELDREQGLLSDNAVLALQVTLNDRRETLFDTRLALVQAEQQLARVLGEGSLDGRSLDDDFEGLLEIDDLGSTEGVLDGNPNVQSVRLSVEQARMQGLLNNLTDRPQLNVQMSAQPLYPVVREDPDDPGSSINDYFEDDADIATTVSVSLRIPILTRRERAAREQIDNSVAAAAQIDLEDTELATLNLLETLRTNRRFLEERRSLLDTDIAYQERRLRNERDLLAAGASTQLRVDEVELDLISRRNERWEVTAELFLNAIDILAVIGEEPVERLTDG